MQKFYSAFLALSAILFSLSVNAQIVISQVYGGGGNSGATYKNDFIELYNPTSTTVSLTGWSVQYASATGTSWQVTTLSGSIAPGKYYLIQQASVTDGLLDINIIGKVHPLKRIRYLPVIEKGKHMDLPFVLYKQESKIYIKTDRLVDAHLDGEYFSANEFKIECLPKRILFVV